MLATYSVSSQEEILVLIRGVTHISTIVAASFLYQWLGKPEHRNRLAVVSHRGQESFNVAVMGYRNSPAYIQRRINTILRPCHAFARAYVDDIVIFSRSIDEHVDHLRQVLKTIDHYNISLKPGKVYIGYPSVQLLGQRVDALGLTMAKEKLEATITLEFLKTESARNLPGYNGLPAPLY